MTIRLPRSTRARREQKMVDRLLKRLAGFAAVLTVFLPVSGGAAHPLDPLSAEEITAAVAVLRAAGLADPNTRFPLIALDEPAKAAVLAWQPGQPVGRAAFV